LFEVFEEKILNFEKMTSRAGEEVAKPNHLAEYLSLEK
jgi:hypothetical protein